MSENSGEYQLIFEGLEEESPDTVRKIKGLLIAEAQLSVEEVKEALESPPRLVKASHSEKMLKSLARKLKEAAAKVTIVPPADEPSATDESLPADLIEFDTGDTESEPVAPLEEAPVDSGLEFAFDPDELSEASTKKDSIPTYELNLEESLDPSLLSFEDADDPSPADAAASAPEPVDDGQLDAQLGSLLDLTIADEPAAPLPTQEEAGTTEDVSTSSLELIDEMALEPEIGESSKTVEPEPEVPQAASGLTFEEEEPPPVHEPEPPPAQPAETPAISGGISLESEQESHSQAQDDKEAATQAHEEPQATPETQISSTADLQVGRLGDRLKNRKAAEEPPEPANVEPEEKREESSAPIPPPPPPRKAGVFRRHDIAAPVIVGALILGIVNWFVFSSDGDSIELDLKQAVEQNLAKPPKPERRSEAAKPEPTPVPKAYIKLTGAAEADRIEARAELMANDESVLSGSLTISMPKPRELTPEEIVQNKVRDPWVTHIDVDARQIRPDPSGAFEWEGPAKVYIEYRGKRDRLLASSTLTGRYFPKESRFEARYEITRPAGLEQKNRTFYLEVDEKDGYKLALRGSLTGIETARNVDEPGVAPTAGANAPR